MGTYLYLIFPARHLYLKRSWWVTFPSFCCHIKVAHCSDCIYFFISDPISASILWISISSEQVRMFWGLFFWIFSASQFWNMHQPLKLSVNRDHLDCLCTFLEGLIIKCHFRHPALDEALGMWKSCTKCSRSKVMITINEIYKLPDIAWLIE